MKNKVGFHMVAICNLDPYGFFITLQATILLLFIHLPRPIKNAQRIFQFPIQFSIKL